MPRFDVSDYVDVDERIDRFWEKYPDGRIITEMISDPGDFGKVVFKALLYADREDEFAISTGWAAEEAGSGGANLTSWHENCETSAIGRAIANLGFTTSRKGKKEPRASKQEMEKVGRLSALKEKMYVPSTVSSVRSIGCDTGSQLRPGPSLGGSGYGDD